ncbi:hypothetical protein INR99_06645 [Chitinilyticum litopenaei]|uniref:Uncharacterized protein n=1 Tax=Chitinilyticum piscinae TaxID=2866724 RepID=A0A8J7FZ60_9NEIS|nr:hypothetical protein [Chitinilyticum piscinae]
MADNQELEALITALDAEYAQPGYPLAHGAPDAGLLNSMAGLAPLFLEPARLQRFYFHRLRKLSWPGAECSRSYASLEAAHDELCLLRRTDSGWLTQRSQLQRLESLWVFGHDGLTRLGRNSDASHYLRHLKALQQTDRCASLPELLARPAVFAELAADEALIERLSASLLALEFRHDDWYDPDGPEAAYNWTSLKFWGAIYLLLFSEASCARDCIVRFTLAASLPHYRKQMETLQRMARAAESYRMTRHAYAF